VTENTCRVALKEWAITVRALDAGKQIVLLRKGGIREESKEFRVLYPDFLLYPTYEHQRDDLLQEAFHQDLQATLTTGDSLLSIPLQHWARVHDAVEVTDQSLVDALSPYHIWTTDYAQKRLHWKPRKPLMVMLLRVYRLAQPQTIPVLPEYAGCKSWVQLDQDVPLGHMTPVLSLETFQSKVDGVHAALRLAGTRL